MDQIKLQLSLIGNEHAYYFTILKMECPKALYLNWHFLVFPTRTSKVQISLLNYRIIKR